MSIIVERHARCALLYFFNHTGMSSVGSVHLVEYEFWGLFLNSDSLLDNLWRSSIHCIWIVISEFSRLLRLALWKIAWARCRPNLCKGIELWTFDSLWSYNLTGIYRKLASYSFVVQLLPLLFWVAVNQVPYPTFKIFTLLKTSVETDLLQKEETRACQ